MAEEDEQVLYDYQEELFEDGHEQDVHELLGPEEEYPEEDLLEGGQQEQENAAEGTSTFDEAPGPDPDAEAEVIEPATRHDSEASQPAAPSSQRSAQPHQAAFTRAAPRSTNNAGGVASTSAPQSVCYFIIRSAGLRNLEISQTEGAWATLHHNENKLNEAFRSYQQVRLLFSVNSSGHFQGYAVMRTPIGHLGRTVYWDRNQVYGGAFGVDWRCVCNLSYNALSGLTNPLNDDKPVHLARDGQEVPRAIGDQIAALMEASARRHKLQVPAPRPGASSSGRPAAGRGRGAGAVDGRGGRGQGRAARFGADGPLGGINPLAAAMTEQAMMASMMGMGNMGPGMMNPAMMQAMAMRPQMPAANAMGNMGMGAQPGMAGMGTMSGMGAVGGGMQGGMGMQQQQQQLASAGLRARSRSPVRRDRERERDRDRGRSDRRRSRSRSRSRERRPPAEDLSKPELLNMSYDEYLEYYRKVQRTIESKRGPAQGLNGGAAAAAGPSGAAGGAASGAAAASGGPRQIAPLNGGSGMVPGAMQMQQMLPQMGGGMMPGGLMGPPAAMMAGMGMPVMPMMQMGGALPVMPVMSVNPMMAAMPNMQMANLQQQMLMGMGGAGGMGMGMAQQPQQQQQAQQQQQQPYSEDQYVQLTIQMYQNQGKQPPSEDFIRSHYRQKLQQQQLGGGRA